MDNKTFYNQLYRTNQEKKSFEISSKTDAFKFLVKNKNLNFKNKTVLDIGFGSGNILEVLKNLGAICHGTEISQTAIDNLKSNGFFLKYTNSETLPYDNVFFDVIVSSHTVEHIPDEKKILQEINRILKPDGIFIMGVPTGKTGYNPLHFRNYSENDIQRLSTQLKAELIYYRNFGGAFFYFFYRIINRIIGIIFSSKYDSNKNEFVLESNRKYSILRSIYQKTVVNALRMLYAIDMYITSNNGIEIWYIFRKGSCIGNTKQNS